MHRFNTVQMGMCSCWCLINMELVVCMRMMYRFLVLLFMSIIMFFYFPLMLLPFPFPPLTSSTYTHLISIFHILACILHLLFSVGFFLPFLFCSSSLRLLDDSLSFYIDSSRNAKNQTHIYTKKKTCLYTMFCKDCKCVDVN